MLRRILSWLRPPIFEGEEDKNRSAFMVHVILLTFALIVIVVMLSDAASGVTSTAPILIFSLIGMAFIMVRNRQGYPYEAGFLLLFTTLVIMTWILSHGQGIHDVGITLYPVVIVLAAVLLPKIGLIVISAFTLISLLIVVFGPELGWFTLYQVDVNDARPGDFVIVTGILVLTAVAIRQVMHFLRSSLDRLRESETALVKQSALIKASETRWRSLAESAPDQIVEMDSTGLILFTNNSLLEQSQILVGHTIYEFMQPETHESARAMITEVIATRTPQQINIPIVSPRGATVWFSARIGLADTTGDLPRLIIFLTNITETLANQTALRQRSEQLAALNQIAHATGSLQNLDSLLEVILEQFTKSISFDTLYIGLYNPTTALVNYPLFFELGERQTFEPQPVVPHSFTAEVLHLGKPLWFNSVTEEFATNPNRPQLQLGDRENQPESLLMAPLLLRGEIIGLISVQTFPPNAYTQSHLDFLSAAASLVANSIQNARLFDALQSELAERKRAEEEIRKLNDELESRVQQRTEELQATKKELDDFSYTISHDLRAPARAIHGFSRLLFEKSNDTLDEEGQGFLAHIISNGQRMGQLVDDLLVVYRLARVRLDKTNIDLGSLVNETAGEVLKHYNRTREQAGLRIDPLPMVEGDYDMLRQVYYQLLDNAVKFSMDRSQARVEVGCTNRDASPNVPVFYIRDNGVGFDMRYAKKLFGVFQRLHLPEEYPGTGVGLAITQHIIRRHGGRIWVEAAPDQGATFYFTLN